MTTRRWMSRVATAAALALVGGSFASFPTPAYAATPIPIATIQGTGASTPYAGKQVTTKPSVVTAVYGQGSSAEFRGFVIQTPGTGGRAKSLRTPSDAIFVYLSNTAFDVRIGEQVSVSGVAGEFNGLTQIVGSSIARVPGRYRAVKPVTG
ncbi:MAG: hypothetical protein H0T91_03415, partial [Propionibacteriaceae bacterium]|nr:hypothetical protein [Propionibacteriaceae bacterium]